MDKFLEEINKGNLYNEAKTKNVLSLAFLGDAVWTLFIRAKITNESRLKSGGLHKLANKFVSAISQSLMYNQMCKDNFLLEDELEYGRRARNTKFGHMAKHASDEQYRDATSFECVLGYLYILQNVNRAMEIMNYSYEFMIKELEKCK